MKLISFIPIAFMLFPCLVSAQDSLRIQTKYVRYVERTSQKYEKRVTQYSQKVLARFSKEEEKIKRRLETLDPQKAKALFANDIQSYSYSLKSRIYSKIPLNSHLDTVQLSLQFLRQKGMSNACLNQAIKSREQLQGKLKVTEDIQAYIQTRRKLLQEQLIQYTQFSMCGHIMLGIWSMKQG